MKRFALAAALALAALAFGTAEGRAAAVAQPGEHRSAAEYTEVQYRPYYRYGHRHAYYRAERRAEWRAWRRARERAVARRAYRAGRTDAYYGRGRY
jgi:hypothetical protein